jgi:hypothetical protein
MGLILKAFIILIFASALEVGGDALIRLGLGGATYAMAAGALTLFAYGFVVNKSGLDFNRLMGSSSKWSKSSAIVLHRAVDLGLPEFTRHVRTLGSELAKPHQFAQLPAARAPATE